MPTARFLLWGGLLAAAGGALLCVLGWYGISGERFAERQLPYLASCTVPGAALLVAGAVLVAAAVRAAPPGPAEDSGAGGDGGAGGNSDGGADGGAPPPSPSSDGPPLRVPDGTLAHRPDCPLVAGRPDAVPAAGDPALAPCPVCEPWPP
ncbi:hypothetical protein [Streptomyces sp. NPDC058757]|uniref:hypothetical protein n=1 Tax=Streptomyces sp. NPDC058757 TaxID=3346626 RepID=UPI0036A00B12